MDKDFGLHFPTWRQSTCSCYWGRRGQAILLAAWGVYQNSGESNPRSPTPRIWGVPKDEEINDYACHQAVCTKERTEVPTDKAEEGPMEEVNTVAKQMWLCALRLSRIRRET
eukprot:scaffold55341_cov15-Tisochrysis_lutea.AAC.1